MTSTKKSHNNKNNIPLRIRMSAEVTHLQLFKNKNSFLYRCVRLFFGNDLTSAAAEMAYFLVFAFFPLLMVVHASLSMAIQGFDIQNTFFYTLLPNALEELVDSYLQYIGQNSDVSYLVIGIVLTVYTLSRFMKSAKRTVRRIYRSHGYKMLIAEWGISIVVSILIIAAFYVSLIVVILGGQIAKFLNTYLPFFDLLHIQSISRILFTAATIYAVVTLFYLWIPNIRQGFWNVLPGTIFTSACWVLVSTVFSFYMNHFSNYSLVYGSIGAFIMLLLWIYMSCLILLIGAVVNAALYFK